jgi:hypothetical protein
MSAIGSHYQVSTMKMSLWTHARTFACARARVCVCVCARACVHRVCVCVLIVTQTWSVMLVCLPPQGNKMNIFHNPTSPCLPRYILAKFHFHGQMTAWFIIINSRPPPIKLPCIIQYSYSYIKTHTTQENLTIQNNLHSNPGILCMFFLESHLASV